MKFDIRGAYGNVQGGLDFQNTIHAGKARTESVWVLVYPSTNCSFLVLYFFRGLVNQNTVKSFI